MDYTSYYFTLDMNEPQATKDTELCAEDLGPRQVLLGKAHRKESKKPQQPDRRLS